MVIIAKLLRRDIAGVGKQEIKNTPLIGTIMELAGTVFIDRSSAQSAIESMQPLVDAMRHRDKSVVISPEGTRTITPKLGPFKKGPFHLAIQAGVPVVPIVIHNAGDVAPKGDFVFRPATVEVDVLPPVDTRHWRAETIDQHVAEVRALFLNTLGQEEDGSGFSGKPEKQKKTRRLKKAVRIDRALVEKSIDENVPDKKSSAKKAPVKTASVKKTSVRKANVKKATVKKSTAKKATAKKTTAKKVAVNKTAVKKAGVKKTVIKKASVKQVSAGKKVRKKAFRKKVGVKKAGGINDRKNRARASL